MSEQNVPLESWRTHCTGIGMMVLICSFFGMSFGEGIFHAVAEEPTGKSQPGSSVNPDKTPEKEGLAPVLGGGIRKPPDIGAGGVATPTPPVETQSPTNEPEIVPPASLGLPQPSDSTIPPLDEGEPPVGLPSDQDEHLGQPDFLKK
jgi:hypothetical protein